MESRLASARTRLHDLLARLASSALPENERLLMERVALLLLEDLRAYETALARDRAISPR
jgi:hypothetical protein